MRARKVLLFWPIVASVFLSDYAPKAVAEYRHDVVLGYECGLVRPGG